MPTGPLIYEILLFTTLAAGLLGLLAGQVPRRGKRTEVRRSSGEPSPATPEEPGRHKTDEEWRRQLTPEQYEVIRLGVTERPFSGEYWDNEAEGTYHCVGCGMELFDSNAKFVTDTGWPSFRRPVGDTALVEMKDISFGLVRTEAACRGCEAHLGHVFADGPAPTGLRYCINSIALEFHPIEISIEAAAGE